MSDVDEWPTYKMVSFETKCFNGLQRCCLQHAVKLNKVLASLASQAIVFEPLSEDLVPLCPHCFNPAFLSHINPCTDKSRKLTNDPWMTGYNADCNVR
jgi:hypothetical protein